MRNANVYLVGGGKGGTGKSTVSISLIDLLLARGQSVLLIEADTSNPDVAKTFSQGTSHGDQLAIHAIKLDERDGWLDLLNLLDANPQMTCVINTPARSGEFLDAHGSLLNDALPELFRKLIGLWVIDRDIDVLQLLKKYLQVFGQHPINVVRNLTFGEAEMFDVYAQSNVRKLVEASGATIDFPALAKRVATQLRSKRIPPSEAIVPGNLAFGDRIEACRWRNEVHAVLGAIL